MSDSISKTLNKKYQFIWWGFSLQDWYFGVGTLDPAKTDMAYVYEKIYSFGPIEIRKYSTREIPETNSNSS